MAACALTAGICSAAAAIAPSAGAFVHSWNAAGPRRRLSVHRGALSKVDASKLDGTPDELFYLLPRVGIYHVDDGFRAQLTQLYRLLVPPNGDVLDLCSQHDSHLPPEVEYRSLTVHGMNYLELLANRRATRRFTQNFNRDPQLEQLADESVDAALMSVSIQYMQRPGELLREVHRALRPGGVAIVSFSNRMFFTKAVEAWRSQSSMRGLATLVQGYFAEAGFTGVRVANGVRLPSAGAGSARAGGDPFLAVIGFRSPAPEDAGPAEGVSWLATSGPGTIW